MNSASRSIPLENVCSLVTDGTHYSPQNTGGNYPFVTVKNMTEKGLDFTDASFISELEFEKAQQNRACPKYNDVLFSKDGTVGKVHVVKNERPFAILSSIAILRPIPRKLDSDYLAFILRHPATLEEADSRKTGSARRRIVLKDIKKIPVPLPPLEEQKRIAGILARADRVRQLRRYALQLSDGYLQAVFLRMFGDPVTNPMGWETARIKDLGKVQTGNTPSRKELENFGNHIEWIKTDNIHKGQMRLSSSREGLSQKGLSAGRFVGAGACLVTCVAGSISSIGDVALSDRRVAFNQQINAVTPDTDVDSNFLFGLLRQSKPIVQYWSTAGMKRIITKSKFENLELFRPPSELQVTFGNVVKRYERLRAQQHEAIRQADHLFDMLLHRAFRGDL